MDRLQADGKRKDVESMSEKSKLEEKLILESKFEMENIILEIGYERQKLVIRSTFQRKNLIVGNQ